MSLKTSILDEILTVKSLLILTFFLLLVSGELELYSDFLASFLQLSVKILLLGLHSFLGVKDFVQQLLLLLYHCDDIYLGLFYTAAVWPLTFQRVVPRRTR